MIVSLTAAFDYRPNLLLQRCIWYLALCRASSSVSSTTTTKTDRPLCGHCGGQFSSINLPFHRLQTLAVAIMRNDYTVATANSSAVRSPYTMHSTVKRSISWIKVF